MYDFDVNLLGNASITVVAENPEEARRILKDTLDSINLKNLREKETLREDVTIKESEVMVKMCEKNKNRDKER